MRARRSNGRSRSRARVPSGDSSSGVWPSSHDGKGVSIPQPPERLRDVNALIRRPMKYLCLVYLESSKLHAVPDSECAACGAGFRKNGVLVAAEALEPVDTATTVRVRNGK